MVHLSIFNPFPNKPWLLHVCIKKSFKNTVGKGEIARNEQFLLYPQCFLHFWRTFYHFHQISKLSSAKSFNFSIWKSPKFVVWKRVEPVRVPPGRYSVSRSNFFASSCCVGGYWSYSVIALVDWLRRFVSINQHSSQLGRFRTYIKPRLY